MVALLGIQWSVVRSLELGGIEFVGDHDWKDRTDGVRFAKDKTARVRRKILETVSRHLDYELKEKSEQDPEFFDRATDDIVKMVIGHVEKELRESVVDIFRRNEERPA